MSVTIRLRRMGRNNRAFYRVVATDTRRSNTGKYIESLGWYDPESKAGDFSLKLDRIEYWKSNGAKVSDTVRSLIRRSARKPKAAYKPEPAATAVADPS